MIATDTFFTLNIASLSGEVEFDLAEPGLTLDITCPMSSFLDDSISSLDPEGAPVDAESVMGRNQTTFCVVA
ncbi:hypothetical protein H1R20_g7135, partial [Candolleomyces eurysporus]